MIDIKNMQTSSDVVKNLFFPEEYVAELEPVDDIKEEQLEKDFQKSRETISDVLTSTNNTLSRLSEVIASTDSIRGYEVANQLLNTLLAASKELVNIHDAYRVINQKKDVPGVQNNTQNNNLNLFTGTSAELLKLLKQ